MTFRKVTTCLTLLALALSLPAQIKDEEENIRSNVSWLQKHYFHTIGGTLLFDFYVPPAVKVYYISPSSNGNSDTSVYYSRNWGFNLASVTYDARINIYDFNERSSVSVNLPVSFGFGTTEPGGALSMVCPVLIDYNFGSHSTYNNIDKIGFHFGVGCDLLMTPLIRIERWREINQYWYSPMARVGIKGPYKRHNAFFTVQMSLPQKYYDSSEEQWFKNRIHFKAVVGILLGYD